MINAEQLVKQVLANNIETRNSDKELLIKVWEKQGFIMNPYQKQAFRRLYSAETCRRIRQKIQESGLFPPDEKTARGRKMKENRMRIEMKKKEYIPQYDGLGRLQGYLIK